MNLKSAKIVLSMVLVLVLVMSMITFAFAQESTVANDKVTVTNGYGLLAKSGYKVSGLNTKATIKIDTKVKCLTFEQIKDTIKQSKKYMNQASYNRVVSSSSYKKAGASAGLFCGWLGLSAKAGNGSSKYFRNVQNKEWKLETSDEKEIAKLVKDKTQQTHHLTGTYEIYQNSLIPSEGYLYVELTRIKFYNKETNTTETKLVIGNNVATVDSNGNAGKVGDGQLFLDGDPLGD